MCRRHSLPAERAETTGSGSAVTQLLLAGGLQSLLEKGHQPRSLSLPAGDGWEEGVEAAIPPCSSRGVHFIPSHIRAQENCPGFVGFVCYRWYLPE